MIRCQHGITLIELLIVLAVLSFTGTMIWNVFFQGINFSQKAATNNILQQEANIVIFNLKKIHRTSEQYKIVNTPISLDTPGCKKIEVTYIKSDNPDQTQKIDFYKEGLCFSADELGDSNPNQQDGIIGPISPSSQDANINVTISDQHDPNNKVEIETLLDRLK